MSTVPTDKTAAAAAKPRILIADDSRIVRASLTQHIRDRFDIREVVDGEAAWQAILLDSHIRVVITDLAMPKVDGFELLNRVRSSKVQRVRDLPVIVLTSADESAERERATAAGATDFLDRGATPSELTARLEVLVRLSSTREALQETQAALESSRTVDPDTELLALAFFDKQVEKLVSYARRNLSDVAVIAVRADLNFTNKAQVAESEIDQRAKLVGRALAASIRLEDFGTRTDKLEFCVATQSTGLSGVLRFAARLRKVLENVDAAGPGVEVWTSIGVATLSEELRRGGEELRQLACKRAQQAQSSHTRRIILGAAEGVSVGTYEGRPDDGSMDINLALALIRAGRAPEVVPHLPRLLEQISPLLKLVRQQRELQENGSENTGHAKLQGVPR